MQRSLQILILVVPLVLASCKKPASASTHSKDVVSICFTGDVMLARGVRSTVEQKGKRFLFAKLEPLLGHYKYRFINLECPITNLNHPPKKPFSFNVDSSFVGILTAAGISHATLANNHTDDQTMAGATETYNFLIENGITPIGLKAKNDTTCVPAEINLGKRKVAVFGALGIDLKISNIWYGRNRFFLKSVQTYKKNNPSSFVICYLHWGIEYLKFPSFDQVQLAEKLIDVGADMIIGHHPHVIESIRYYKGKPIFYSLGNLIFDQGNPDTKEGIIAGLTFRDNTAETDIIPYDIEACRPVPLSSEEKQEFKESLMSISDSISLADNEHGWTMTEKSSNQVAFSKTDTGKLKVFSSIRIKDSLFDGTAKLTKLKSMPGYKLIIEDTKTRTTDNLYIPYPVYRFYASDINNDGRTDVLLGVVKSTHFDPIVKKRLFIFRIDSSRLSPLWLGSRVCLKLVDFKPIHLQGRNRIMTVESEMNNLYCDGLYQWDNFGLRLIGYRNENSSRKIAYDYFNDNK
ncbi:MAG: CapA family protein [Dissulfurispiraceae bacterium]